jgi:hypothetical protein
LGHGIRFSIGNLQCAAIFLPRARIVSTEYFNALKLALHLSNIEKFFVCKRRQDAEPSFL